MKQERHPEEENKCQNGTQEETEGKQDESVCETVNISFEELEDLRRKAKELEETREQAKRIMAEYLNYRSRMERERAMAVQQARRTLLTQILPYLDNFIRAVNTLCSSETQQELQKGLQLAVQSLLNSLKKIGVEPILPYGEVFDPRYHEAVIMEDQDDVEQNTILDVVEPGWLLREGETEYVLKAAKVKVAKRS